MNCTFLNATRRKKSSETWRAILHGRQALRKGLIKRIGPGESINVWSDNWVQGLPSFKPLLRPVSAQAEMVCDLFLPGTRQWDEQAIRNTLCAIEAEEILKLRPGGRLPVDIDAWAYEKNGMFSVRSC
jgi:hypothetical protein